MNTFLDFLKYDQPVIQNYYDPVRDFAVVINEDKTEAAIFSKGEKWLVHNFITQNSVWEIFSHYWIAEGHCICTGLGLGLRESWILNKKEVNKVTVLENDEGVIEYHRVNNPKLFKELEIIKTDANHYKGKCDTLLLDHYETEHPKEILKSASSILNNISCERMWLWPLEIILEREYSMRDLSKIHDGYYKIKNQYNLHKLPDISEHLLGLFMVSMVCGLEIEYNPIERSEILEKSAKSWEKTTLPNGIKFNPLNYKGWTSLNHS